MKYALALKKSKRKERKIKATQGKKHCGFAPQLTDTYTAEILRRDPLTDEDEPIQEYKFRVSRPKGLKYCPPGETPETVSRQRAIALAHVRIYDLLFRELHPCHFAYDAHLWKNTSEGRPIAVLSTHDFSGSEKVPVIKTEEPLITEADMDSIKATEQTSMVRRF